MRNIPEILIIDFDKKLKNILNSAFTSVVNFYIPFPEHELKNKIQTADIIIHIKPTHDELIKEINGIADDKDKLVIIIDEQINKNIKGSYVMENNFNNYEKIVNMILNTCDYGGWVTTHYTQIIDVIKPHRIWKFYNNKELIKNLKDKINLFGCIVTYDTNISLYDLTDLIEDIINNCNTNDQLFSLPCLDSIKTNKNGIEENYLVSIDAQHT